ncbi:MAG: acyl carrier protein, partial [Actinomycetota bacterium]|nr:acyl carrier protein [Actinomycetota bacterium]
MREQLLKLSDEERTSRLLALVRSETAELLGFESPEDIAPDVVFKDLGFNSLAAVELATQIVEATGIDVPETALFDYPTPLAVAGFLRREMFGEDEEVAPA